MRLNDIRVSPHFKLREFQCGCCKTVKLRPELLAMLEELRRLRNSPIVITSGYRCPKHNRAVGGAAFSRHMNGAAADIYAPHAEQITLEAHARAVGFAEIIRGGKKNYLHVACG
ncbi:MAG: DUF882 domain-containing protein [Synergistaceae bacterium]|nr:DUF882 domain-containing protein [Synergistaceae bacterium]